MPLVPHLDPSVARRNVYFHKVVSRAIDAGAAAFDREAAVAAISALAGTDSFYLDEGEPEDEQHLCAVVDRAESPQRVRFYRVRRRDLPETEAGGVFRALELSERDGLAESIHVVLFEDGIVGSEYNHYGPRATTFGTFLNERCGQDVRLRPLVRADVIDKILNMQEIRTLRIKVDPSAATALQQSAGGLGGAFDAADVFSAGRYLDLKVATTAHDEEFTDKVKRLFRSLRDRGGLEHLGAGEVYGKNEAGELEVFNVLHDMVVVNTTIQRESPRSRALSRDPAYAAVEDAYAGLADDIRDAGTITVG